MDWTTIIVSIGGSAALFGALAWLTRSIIVHFLDKDVERFKNALQLKAIEHQVRFNSLHIKRAEIIAELYQRLEVANTAINGIKSSEDKNFSEKDKAMSDTAVLSCIEAIRFFRQNELYFDEELCAKVRELNLTVLKVAAFYGGMSSLWNSMIAENKSIPPDRLKLLGDVVEHGIVSWWKTFDNKIPGLLDDLKKQFRFVLGVSQPVKS